MDHRADLPATPPWRSAAFIAASVATVELLILLGVGIWLFGNFFSDEVTKATDPTTVARAAVEREMGTQGATTTGKTNEAKPILRRRETSVLVLNGNGLSGAADEAAAQVRRHRYLIAGTGNAERTDYPRSLVMFRPGYEREARRLADDLDVRRVVPLDGMRRGELQGAHVALVIGS